MDKNNKFPKLLILGSARHGKDTLAEIFNVEFDFTFKSSSVASSEIFLYDILKEKYGYSTPLECFEDRINHRSEWYELITEYNSEDKAKLAKEILKNADCYVGMRNPEEINECLKQNLFDLIIWVDASERLPIESTDSFKIDKSVADIIISNNDDYESFKKRAINLGKIIFKK